MGRKKIEIDWKQVEELAAIMCTQIEIAAVLGISTKTLQRSKKFWEVYDRGREKAKTSLRRAQFKKAMDGNTTMLIWLGKQYLEQREKTDNINKNEDIITIVDPFSEKKEQ